jgi:shikimate kinase
MNVTLIGMSGVGKSRIGLLLSRKLKYGFIDIDRKIEQTSGKKLQETLDCLGDAKFLQLEENTILSIGNLCDSVISPGGSSIYSQKAMAYLKSISKTVFLGASLDEIKKRTVDFSGRGIVGLKQKGLEKLFLERLPLYRLWADFTINMAGLSDQAVVDRVIEAVL